MAFISMALGLTVLTAVKNQLVRVSTENYKKQQSQLANQIAETLSSNLENVQNQLILMASMPEVQSFQDTERCRTRLAELLKINQKQLGNLGRVDSEGYFRCSVNQSLIGQHTSQYGTYVSDLINDPQHKPVLSRVTRPAGVDSFAVGLHVPVYEGGKFSGTLGGALYFNQFQDQYLRSIKLGNNGHVVVIDDNGGILYHPSPEQNGKNLLSEDVLKLFEPQETMHRLLEDVKAGKSGAFDYSVQGTQKTGLYKTFKVPNTDRHWSVIVTLPVEDFAQVVNQAGVNRIFLVLVLLFAFTTGLLTFLSLRNTLKALEVQRMKDEFISITSHQLRTPATVVKQYLGLIKDGFVSNKKDMAEFVDAAYKSNDDQLEIIQNILSISRLEAGHMELQKEPVALQDLIKRISEVMQMHVKQKELTLRMRLPAKPLHLQADPTKLTMAIENLISNAVKYTPEGGTITITARRRQNEVQIAVKDTGKGIPVKEMPKLFKRFNRMKSAVADQVPGTGLGLYLTKLVVELHGGTIAVESAEDKGSTFTITLPAA